MPDNFKINQTTIRMIKDDLTALEVEAFVYYARTDLSLGSGYGNEISTRGGPTIKAELDKIGGVEPFSAIISAAGNLNAKHIIHAVGPKFQEIDAEKKLAITVENTLKCADGNGITQIAFPLMGTGFYGIPLNSSIDIMIDSFKKHLSGKTSISEIIICANDNREYRPLAEKFMKLN